MATTKNTADLLAQAVSTLPDNTTQQISPEDVRQMDENIAQSSYNKITDSALVGLKEYSTIPTYESGQGCINSGKVYISNKITGPGAFVGADWDLYDELSAADKAKLDFITVTSGADLDQMQTDIAALDGARINKGTFDQALGAFPGGGTAQDGWTWIAVGVTTTIDGVEINPDDAIVAITDNASTTTFAGNWHLQDNTDKVISVNTKAGVVVLDKTDIGLSNVPNTDATLRGNHTGTQTAATISDFDTEVANNTAVAANTAKVSNVTTNISTSRTATQVNVESSDGLDAIILGADSSNAGVLTSAKFDEIGANTAKVSFPEAPNDGKQYARISLGWAQVVAGTNFANTYWVDPSGNDGTGALGDNAKPFLTLEAARDQAITDGANGKLIIVKAGSYTVTTTDADGLNVDGLNWHYEMGAVVTKATTGWLYVLNLLSNPTSVTGHGKFVISGACTGAFYTYRSNVIIEFSEISSTVNASCIRVESNASGYYPTIKGNRVSGTLKSPVEIANRGSAHFDIAETYYTGLGSAIDDTTAAAYGGVTYVGASVVSTAGAGIDASGGTYIINDVYGSTQGLITTIQNAEVKFVGSVSTIIVSGINAIVNFDGVADFATVSGDQAKLLGGVVDNLTTTNGYTETFLGMPGNSTPTANINGGKAVLRRREWSIAPIINVTAGELTLNDNIDRSVNTLVEFITLSGGTLYLNGLNKIGGSTTIKNFMTISGGKLVLRGTIDYSAVTTDSWDVPNTCIVYEGGTIVSEGGTLLMGAETANVDERTAIVSTVAPQDVFIKGNLFLDRTNPILAARAFKTKVTITAASVSSQVQLNDTTGSTNYTATPDTKANMALDLVNQINADGAMDMTASQDTSGVDEYFYVTADIVGLQMYVRDFGNCPEKTIQWGSYAMTDKVGGTIVQDIDMV